MTETDKQNNEYLDFVNKITNSYYKSVVGKNHIEMQTIIMERLVRHLRKRHKVSELEIMNILENGVKIDNEIIKYDNVIIDSPTLKLSNMFFIVPRDY